MVATGSKATPSLSLLGYPFFLQSEVQGFEAFLRSFGVRRVYGFVAFAVW